MMRPFVCLCLALPLLAACTTQPVEASVPVLAADRYGPVKFGARLADVESKVGSKALELGTKDPACHSVHFASLPGVRFMVENEIVTRADAGPGVANALGLTPGDTLATAKDRHPALHIGPHKYEPAGHYLTMKSPDGRSAIVMEEDGKAITKIRAGVLPSVNYVEGCL